MNQRCTLCMTFVLICVGSAGCDDAMLKPELADGNPQTSPTTSPASARSADSPKSLHDRADSEERTAPSVDPARDIPPETEAVGGSGLASGRNRSSADAGQQRGEPQPSGNGDAATSPRGKTGVSNPSRTDAGSPAARDEQHAAEWCLFAAYLSDGRVLASYTSTSGSHLVLLDGRTGEEQLQVAAPIGWTSCLAANGRIYAVALPEGIAVYEVPSLHVLRTLTCDTRDLKQLKLSAHGRVLVACSEDDFYVYDVPQSRLRHHVTQAKGFGLLAISPEGKRALVSGAVTKYFDLETGRKLPTQLRRPGVALFLPPSQKDSVICSVPGGQLGIVQVGPGNVRSYIRWPVARVRRRAKLAAPPSTAPTCMDLSADGKKLVVGYTSGLIAVWNVQSGSLEQELDGHVDRVASVSFSPHADVVASRANHSGTLFLWPLTGGRPVAVSRGNSARPISPSVAKQLRDYRMAITGLIRARDLTAAARICTEAADLAQDHPELDDMFKYRIYDLGLKCSQTPAQVAAWVERYYSSLTTLPQRLGQTRNVKLEAIFQEILLLSRLGKRADAIRLCEEGAARSRELEGQDSLWIDAFARQEELALNRTGQLAKAEEICFRRLKSAEERVTQPAANAAEKRSRQSRVALALEDLVSIYRRQKKYTDALRIYQTVLDRGSLSSSQRSHHSIMLGQLYEEMGRLDDAERAFKDAVDSADEGQRNIPLDHLYRFCIKHERFDGLPSVIDAKLQRERNLRGASDPSVLAAARDYVQLLSSVHLWNDATRLLDATRRGWSECTNRHLAAQAEWAQLLFLNGTYRPRFEETLSFAWHRRTDPRIPELSAAWVINGKGVRVAVLAERQRLVAASKDPEVQAAAAELKSVRSRIAALSMSDTFGLSSEELNDRYSLLNRLAHQAGELSRQVSVAGWTELREKSWVDLQDVRRHLPTDGVLIEFAKVPVFDEAIPIKGPRWTKPREVRYLAWLVYPEADVDVQLVDLGRAAAIDTAVVAFHETVDLINQGAQNQHGRTAADAVNRALASIATSVLTPLLPHIKDRQRWVLCPDGALWMVPWAALPLSAARYVTEEHRVACVQSGRDVTPFVRGQAASGVSVIVADPAYGAASSHVSRNDLFFPPLPGTAQEANHVTPLLEKITGVRPRVLTGAKATELAVKAVVRPRILLLSTHGFFLPVDTGGNPLAACGLALAAANHTTSHRENPNDGYLTGIEVLSLDLRGTELVVLSACETGVGLLEYGEGVVGLRRAFLLAGARSVVATLWSIPDRETAVLMTRFFENLNHGQSQAEALQTAQQALIKSQRRENGTVNPLAWAAFTLTTQRLPD